MLPTTGESKFAFKGLGEESLAKSFESVVFLLLPRSRSRVLPEKKVDSSVRFSCSGYSFLLFSAWTRVEVESRSSGSLTVFCDSRSGVFMCALFS